jgi:hypothetical protein
VLRDKKVVGVFVFRAPLHERSRIIVHAPETASANDDTKSRNESANTCPLVNKLILAG